MLLTAMLITFLDETTINSLSVYIIAFALALSGLIVGMRYLVDLYEDLLSNRRRD